ncbi:MAG: hypothetical protein NC191_06935 [Muribaculaceae bacterium]|nr:hypothetical protein [Muribaculaceae bacterium]
MNRNKIDTLIVYLLVIQYYAKELHYNCCGTCFYSNHLFADRIAKNLDEYIDSLKEVCLLGHGNATLPESEYLRRAADAIPQSVYDYRIMRDIIQITLSNIEDIKEMSKGEENIIGAIAQDLQNNVGLINIMLGDIE